MQRRASGEKDKRDNLTKNGRHETKYGCLAEMCVKHTKSGKWVIAEFVAVHNHLLRLPSCSHMIRSQQGIDESKGLEVEVADASKLTSKQIYELSSSQSGGRVNPGYTWQDQKKLSQNQKAKRLQIRGSGLLVGIFSDSNSAKPFVLSCSAIR